MVNTENLEHAENVVPTHHLLSPYSRVALVRRRRSSGSSLLLLFRLRLSASSTSTTTSSTLWRRSKGTVGTYLHHVIYLLLVVSLQMSHSSPSLTLLFLIATSTWRVSPS